MKKVVYTVITDTSYKLKRMTYDNKGWDFVCFSDQDIKSKFWDIRKFPLEVKGLGPKKKSRQPKILYHKFVQEYDISVYLDSKFVVRLNLDKFVKTWLANDDMAVMSHNKRNNVFEEAAKIIQLKLDTPSVVNPQIDKYKSEGIPEGLYAPGITIRRHGSESLEKCMELWFDELLKHSYRDILSLPYALWKFPVKLGVMPWHKVYKLFR